MSQFLGYCLNPADGSWTPPVHLVTVEACSRYCVLHHRWAPEIRICDEDDFVVLYVEHSVFVVLYVEHSVLKCPLPDGAFREMRL
jgi:hypothetical protein